MGNVEMKVVLLYANPYKFVNKDGEEAGEVIEGIGISYYSEDNLNPVYDSIRKVFGGQTISASLPYSELANIKSVPGYYLIKGRMENVKAKQYSRDVIISTMRPDSIKFLSECVPPAQSANANQQK